MPWRDLRIGNRSPEAVLSAPFKRAHYRAFLRTFSVVSSPLDHLRRYVGGGGEYPHTCEVGTPLGKQALELFSSHDVTTVTEVFCREDYRCRADLKVAVDIGANIGVSGLYFLTRNPGCRVYLFEPDPRNVARLRSNLARHSDRTHVEEAAIVANPSPDGTVSFSPEPTGRYGRVSEGGQTGEEIAVRAVAIDEALRRILAREDRIDVLKIDTEGSEPELVAALAPELLGRVDLIYFEAAIASPLHRDLFDHSQELSVNRLARRDAAPA